MCPPTEGHCCHLCAGRLMGWLLPPNLPSYLSAWEEGNPLLLSVLQIRIFFCQVSLLTAGKSISESRIPAAASSHSLLLQKEKEKSKDREKDKDRDKNKGRASKQVTVPSRQPGSAPAALEAPRPRGWAAEGRAVPAALSGFPPWEVEPVVLVPLPRVLGGDTGRVWLLPCGLSSAFPERVPPSAQVHLGPGHAGRDSTLSPSTGGPCCTSPCHRRNCPSLGLRSRQRPSRPSRLTVPTGDAPASLPHHCSPGSGDTCGSGVACRRAGSPGRAPRTSPEALPTHPFPQGHLGVCFELHLLKQSLASCFAVSKPHSWQTP